MPTSKSLKLPTLHAGEKYAGILLDKKGNPESHLILLMGEVSLAWKEAQAWAAKQKGSLPTRREQRLLYANLEVNFTPNWYWSSKQSTDHMEYAWCQNFLDGFQLYERKSAKLRARAVRRLIIE